MLICHDCGEVFEKPKVLKSKVGDYWGAPAWEEWDACPYCESTEVYEAEQCQRCGEWVPELTEYGGIYICEICLDDLTG